MDIKENRGTGKITCCMLILHRLTQRVVNTMYSLHLSAVYYAFIRPCSSRNHSYVSEKYTDVEVSFFIVTFKLNEITVAPCKE